MPQPTKHQFTGKISPCLALALGCFLLAEVFGCGAAEQTLGPAPTANAGFDRQGVVGTPITLLGTASAAANNQETEWAFQWQLASGPPGHAATLDGAQSPTPTLQASTPGRYLVVLTVQSGEIVSAPDWLEITLSQSPESQTANTQLPVASALCVGGCQAPHGASLTVDGRASFASNNAALTHTWSQILDAQACAAQCPEIADCQPLPDQAQIDMPNAERTSLALPAGVEGSLILALEVQSQNQSQTSPTATTCLPITLFNQAPTAAVAQTISTAGGGATSISVASQRTFGINGSLSQDLDTHDSLTYLWSVQAPEAPEGLTLVFNDEDIPTPQVAILGPAPQEAFQAIFRLSVDDGFGPSVCDVDVCLEGSCCVQVEISP